MGGDQGSDAGGVFWNRGRSQWGNVFSELAAEFRAGALAATDNVGELFVFAPVGAVRRGYGVVGWTRSAHGAAAVDVVCAVDGATGLGAADQRFDLVQMRS